MSALPGNAAPPGRVDMIVHPSNSFGSTLLYPPTAMPTA